MAYKVDLSMPPNEVLLGQINYENKTSFTLENVGFREDGVHVVDEHERDTMVWLIAKKGTYGMRRIYYNRLDLNEFLGDRVLELDEASEGQQHTHLFIPAVLKRLGIYLNRDDVISDIVPVGAEEFDIRISPRCLIYRGTIRVRYTNDSTPLLRDRVVNTILDGFQLPT